MEGSVINTSIIALNPKEVSATVLFESLREIVLGYQQLWLRMPRDG